jgi:trans-AT polyketide synthase/acyltransferase/oxidoreductase domain-containing protein
MMPAPVVFMFAGQGGQTLQMGSELYRHEPVFREWMQRLDAQASAQLEISLLDMLYGEQADRFAPFDRLLYTHPALFMVQYALAKTLQAEGIQPDMLLGASLGEWVALSLSEVMPVEQALSLVIDFARLVEQQAASGGMLAVLASPDLPGEQGAWFEGLEFAGSSYAGHFVVAGARGALHHSEACLADAGIACQLLPVRYAFHSAAMDALQAPLMTLFARRPFAAPRLPLISCTSADFCRAISAETLWSTVRRPIDFSTTLTRLEHHQESRFIDLSPSGSMAALARQAVPRGSASRIHAVMNLFGRDLQGLEQLRSDFGSTHR